MTPARYEIYTYEYGIDAQGNHSPLDGGEFSFVPAVQTGWTVYVREYDTDDQDGDWNEVYDTDFKTEDERDAAIAALQLQYPGADITSY